MKMFEKYDNPALDKDECCCNFCIDHPKDELLSYSGTEITFNVKGDMTGLAFHNRSTLNFIFDFSGYVIDDFGDQIDAEDFLNAHKLQFNLFNFKMKPAISATFDGQVHDGIMHLQVSKEHCEELQPGNYSIELKVETDNGYYALFSPQDANILIL